MAPRFGIVINHGEHMTVWLLVDHNKRDMSVIVSDNSNNNPNGYDQMCTARDLLNAIDGSLEAPND